MSPRSARPSGCPAAGSGLILTASERETLRGYLRETTGLRIDDERVAGFQAALHARLLATGAATLAAYWDTLVSSPDRSELDRLLDLFTVGETYFFRTPAFFAELRTQLLPALMEAKRRAGQRSLRIWSGACASGEEPYSIAITLLNAGIDPEEWEIELLGSDLCNLALERARAGVYSSWAFRGVAGDDQRVWRFFTSTEAGHLLGPRPRHLVELTRFNLVDRPYPRPKAGGQWDMIFLRNVLMYMDGATTDRILEEARDCLEDDGLLFLGECEVLPGPAGFSRTPSAGGAVYRKTTPSRSNRAPPPATLTAVPRRRPARPTDELPRARKPRAAPPLPDLAERAERLHALAAWHFGQEEFAEAHASLQSVLALVPDDPAAAVGLAAIQLNWGDLEQARSWCHRALGIHPCHAEALLLLGVVHFHSGTHEGAINEIRKALYSKPELAVGHFFLGEAHSALAEVELARSHYRRAIAIATASSAARLELGFERLALVGAVERRLRSAATPVPRQPAKRNPA